MDIAEGGQPSASSSVSSLLEATQSTELLAAVTRGDDQTVTELLLHYKEKGKQVRDADNNTPLILAAKYGYVSIAKRLLREGGAKINAANRMKMTALIEASLAGHINIVRLLLKKRRRIDVNAKTKLGATALYFAALGGSGDYVDIFKLLLENGADPKIGSMNGKSVAWVAAKHVGMLTELLKGHTSELMASDESHMLLVRAVEKGQAACVQLLLDAGADATKAEGEYGTTPLMLATACAIEPEAKLRALLSHDPTPNRHAKDNNGRTAFMWAAAGARVETLRVLKEATGDNVDLTHADNDGMTALMLAARFGCAMNVRQLLAWGADPATTNDHDQTAFLYAARTEKQRAEKLQALLQVCGVNIVQVEIALIYTRTEKDAEATKVLQQYSRAQKVQQSTDSDGEFSDGDDDQGWPLEALQEKEEVRRTNKKAEKIVQEVLAQAIHDSNSFGPCPQEPDEKGHCGRELNIKDPVRVRPTKADLVYWVEGTHPDQREIMEVKVYTQYSRAYGQVVAYAKNLERQLMPPVSHTCALALFFHSESGKTPTSDQLRAAQEFCDNVKVKVEFYQLNATFREGRLQGEARVHSVEIGEQVELGKEVGRLPSNHCSK